MLRSTNTLLSSISSRFHFHRLFHASTIRLANRFPRRAAPSAAPAQQSQTITRSPPSNATSYPLTNPPQSSLADPLLSTIKIEGTDSQVALIQLRNSNQSIKVDPASIVSIPSGVEVRPIYGAPQPIQTATPAAAQPQQQQQSGGFFSRFSSQQQAPAPPPPQQQQITCPILAEVVLQPGQPAPTDPVQLSAVTTSKLFPVNLDDFGGELYIARGSFLASSATVNINNSPDTGIPNLNLQRVDGSGDLVLKVSGQVLIKDLAPNEKLYIQSNRFVAVESSVLVAGGAGAFLSTLTGPGRIVLQSLPSLETALAQQQEQTMAVANAAGIPTSALGPSATYSPLGPGFGGGGLGRVMMEGMAFGVGSSKFNSSLL